MTETETERQTERQREDDGDGDGNDQCSNNSDDNHTKRSTAMLILRTREGIKPET